MKAMAALAVAKAAKAVSEAVTAAEAAALVKEGRVVARESVATGAALGVAAADVAALAATEGLWVG